MPVEYSVPGVYIEEIPSGSRPIQGVATAVAAFIGFTYTRPKGNQGQPVAVYSWNQFVEDFCTIRYLTTKANTEGREVEVEGAKPSVNIYPQGCYLPHAVFGYFQNGGTRCYVQSLHVLEDQELPPQLKLNDKEKPLLTLKPGYSPSEVTITVSSTPQLSSGAPSQSSGSAEEGSANASTQTGGEAASAPNPSAGPQETSGKPGKEQFQVEISVAGRKKEENDKPFTREVAPGKRASLKQDLLDWLKQSVVVDVGDERQIDALLNATPSPYQFSRPQEKLPQSSEPFRGNVTERTGLGALEEISDITMLICPDLMTMYEHMAAQGKQEAGAEAVAGVQNELLAHCARMQDRFAILDSLPGQTVTEMVNWRRSGANYSKDDGKYGALYYPWIKIANPYARNGGDQSLKIPPSGHIAGVYARVDTERGVHKAPANESIRGALGLERRLIDSEQESLNPIGVNCIRAFPNRGILIWGARTLAEAVSEWRYINVRRLFNFIEESIYEGTQWVVFEPNDMDLWERVRRTITAFLTRVWRSGALFGATPEEAFYVKCDAELNPPEVRNAGQLIVEIGIAPVKPAEFVIFRFKQMEDGGGISE
jgi:phage tail sheath protein FI